MQVNKEQFRQLIEEGNIGSAFNRLSDISHFLGESELKNRIVKLAEQYREYLEQEDAGQPDDQLLSGIKGSLLKFIEEMPEELEAGAGEGKGSGGCMGIIASILLIAAGLIWYLF